MAAETNLNSTNSDSLRPNYLVMRCIPVLLVSSFFFLHGQKAQATTYYSDYGMSRTHYINTTAGTHSFQINGIARYRTTYWYVNGSYRETDESGFFAIDPEYTQYISSGTTEIKGDVWSDGFYEETHTWNVTVDTTPPHNPSSFSSNPSRNTWTTDNTVHVSWSGAYDNVGLKRYYYKWTTSSSSSVTTSDSYTNTSSGSGSKTSPALSDSSSWYFHIRYMDTSDILATSTAHYGPFRIDRTNPSTPALVSPSDHSTISDTTPYLDWSSSLDSGSGIDYYEVEVYDWGLEPDISDTASSSYYQVGTNLAFKKWYWKIRAVDRAGNKSSWSDEWDFTIIDTTPPHNPSSFSSNPSRNTWTTDNTVHVSWSGAYDNVGLKRYYYKWTTSSSSSVTISDSYTNTSSGSGSKTSPALSDSSSWYFHIRYMDTSDILATSTAHYGPFRIDRTDPGQPTHRSPPNNGNVGTTRPTLQWYAASDNLSGVSEYHLKVVESWFPYIDIVDKDVTGTIYTLNITEGSNMQWEKTYTWRLYAIDNAGNNGDYTTEWRFTVRDTVKPHNPNSYTSTPPANTWSNSGTISVTWSGAYDNESGLDGYSVVWNQSPTTVPDTTKDQGGNSSSTSYADGSVWSNIYCHVRAVDEAGNWADGALHCGPFNLDREDPGKPQQQSPSNGGSVSTLRPTLTWSAASDGSGSGVAKYHLKVFQNWGVYWDKVDKDVTGTSYTLNESEALEWGKNYGWRLYAIDNVDNDGDYTGNWYFTVQDTVKPHNPTSCSSNPAANVWTNDNTVQISWSGASDSGSGIDGYSIQWSTSSSTVPDTTKDTSGTSTTSSGLADGNWYFHVRSVDNAGNWADGALHCGPFRIDRTDPDIPVLSSPTNGEPVIGLTPTLSWHSSTDGLSGIKEYELLVETNTLGIDKVNKLVDGTTYTLEVSEALDAGEGYKWKVRAIDNAENPGDWSEQWFFSVTEEVVLSDFPDYGIFNVAHPLSLGGICGASGAAAILGYWDRTAYQGITYWNLVDHGGPSTPDASGDVEGLVESLVSEMSYGYDGWWLWPFLQMDQADRDGIITICKDPEYRNNLDFVGNLDDWVHTYGMLKTEIRAGRPLMYGIDRILPTYVGHWLPVYGFRHTEQTKWVTAKRNDGLAGTVEFDFDEAYDDLGSLDVFIRITPGGVPVDHYEEDDSSSYANVIEPEDDYNWLQTHNFDVISDQDWVHFTAEVGYEYLIKTENLGGYASTNLYIYKASDLSTPVVYDANGGAASVSFECLEGMADSYYILSTNANGQSGPETNYDLTIEELALAQYELNLTIVGQGHVNLDPPNIDVYPPGASYTYYAGTPVILTAEAENDWHFVRWEGDTTDSDDTIIVIVDNQRNITAVFEEDVLIVDLTMDYPWMYQNLPSQTGSNLTASVSIIDDPLSNSSYTYEWEFILPSDVNIAPTTVAGGGSGDAFWTFAARGCDEPNGLSDSGQPFTVRVTVTGDDYRNTGTAEEEFGIALLGDVDNDGIVDVFDRTRINVFWLTGSAGPFSLCDCDLDCDGIVDVFDRARANAIWRGILCQNSVSTPCPFR